MLSLHYNRCIPIRYWHFLLDRGVMPARHEDTQDHGKQQLMNKFIICHLFLHGRLSIWIYLAPPFSSSKPRAFSSKDKGELIHMCFLCCTKTVSYSLNIKTIYARNIWILMLYSAFHMLDVNVNYLGNVE